MSRSANWLLACVGGLLLGFSAPPAIVPFAEWLVLPGLAVWFVLANSEHTKLRHSYVYGCIYMAWFSWSVRHVMLPAYLAIVFVGGLYFLLGTAAVRGAPKRGRSLAFAVAVAGTFWLRAVMPDIYYPHGQPCHSFWQWPALMRIVTVGGEPLMNALLALLAATGVQVWQSWRVAVPQWRPSLLRFAVAIAVTVAAVVTGHVLGTSVAPPAEAAPEDRSVRIAAIEPGYHPSEVYAAGRHWREAFFDLLEQRLIAPTAGLLREQRAAGQDLDLVLWPESSLLDPSIQLSDIESGRGALLSGRFPKSDTRLVLGATVEDGDEYGPAALLVELQHNRILDYQPKQWLVPGGEFLPLAGLLPKAWADSVRDSFQKALGTPAHCRPGDARPPMKTAAGVPFGTLLCYDNAFHGPAADRVEAGAEFLVVLSNETWYRGGAELTQLVAMTVVRALENAVPIVRCTMDGHSVAVDADGRVVAGLSIAPAPQSQSRILEVSIERGTGRIPPMAWLRRTCGSILALFTAFGAAHRAFQWVRIRAARTALSAAVAPGSSGVSSGGP
ncbi:MAG: apolipoprotein N-acyltransferase [Planctomycetota bacterium]